MHWIFIGTSHKETQKTYLWNVYSKSIQQKRNHLRFDWETPAIFTQALLPCPKYPCSAHVFMSSEEKGPKVGPFSSIQNRIRMGWFWSALWFERKLFHAKKLQKGASMDLPWTLYSQLGPKFCWGWLFSWIRLIRRFTSLNASFAL